MQFKRIIKKILGIYDFDREAERLVKKSIKLYQKGGINKFRAKRLQNIIQVKFNCSFPCYIKVGKDLFISHPQGVTIGRTAEIGDNCKIYPYAAIIAALKGDVERYNNDERRHAIIGNNCILGYGCIIIGPVTIGDNVLVAAGAIVTKDVPANSVVKNVNEISSNKNNK